MAGAPWNFSEAFGLRDVLQSEAQLDTPVLVSPQ